MNNCIYTAELGINHNGSIYNVFELIDLAKKHNFDYVKFQKRDIESCYTKEYLDSPRESPWGKTQRNQKLRLELSIKNYKDIDVYCKTKGIGWYYSPWDLKSAREMSQFKTDYIKIAKACVNNKDLIDFYNNENNTPIVASVNADNDENYHSYYNNLKYILSCVSLYPSPINYNGLLDIVTLNILYPQYYTGYSNHSPYWIHPVIASYLGAKMIEVHITLDKNVYGSDQKASLDDNDLTNMMKFRYNPPTEKEINNFVKEENEVLNKLRQTW